MEDLLHVLAVLGLVGANAFFVIGEYAVVTARRGAIAARADAGGARARAALRLMDDPVRVISTVQVGITAIGILTGAIGEPLVRDLLGADIPGWLGFALAFGIVTYLSVVLGELVPKALTLERAESLALLVARPVELLAVVLRPLVVVLQGSASALLRPFGVRDVVAGETVSSRDELRAVVDEAEVAGVIPASQEEMLHNVLKFADREARDVMVPAGEVAWLDASAGVAEALDRALSQPHVRYPVGRGSRDRITGVVHVRDLAAALRREHRGSIEELARPPLYVPETKNLGALLQELRDHHQTLAIVGDEYGGTVGIVTVEDVLEELVGEIEDEFDRPEPAITRIDDTTSLVAGSLPVDDLNEALGLHIDGAAVHSVAGLVFDLLGRRPEPGDEVTVGDATLAVAEMRGLRIAQVEVRRSS